MAVNKSGIGSRANVKLKSAPGEVPAAAEQKTAVDQHRLPLPPDAAFRVRAYRTFRNRQTATECHWTPQR